MLTKEALGHSLQFPEGNAKRAPKTKGWQQAGRSVHLSAEAEGMSSWYTHFLGLSGQTQRSGNAGPLCVSVGDEAVRL